MGVRFSLPKGTNDILPEENRRLEYLREKLLGFADLFGYEKIDTPTFENVELFNHSVGETTDIVSKEMYTFSRNDKDTFALKPEGTSPCIRAYIQNGMASFAQPQKLFYLTSCYRAERPQKGRLRQFNQFGVELLGAKGALADAEVIAFADFILKKLGVKGIKLNINSVGCPKCRNEYYDKLRKYVSDNNIELCEECQTRLVKNPMRIFDCKNENCKANLKDAPKMLDNLCEDCNTHFDTLKNALDSYGVDYEVDPTIVRGLDYYTNTAFEFVSGDLGSQSTVCGGGRYDGLVAIIGGDSTPGVGFGMGIERLVMIMEEQGLFPEIPRETDCYIASMGDQAVDKAIKIASMLRNEGISTQTDLVSRSFKAQMKYADKINAKLVILIGEDELNGGFVTLRNMAQSQQENVSDETLVEKIKEILSK